LIPADHDDPAACGREYLRNAMANDAVANDCNRLKPSGVHVSSVILFRLSATQRLEQRSVSGKMGIRFGLGIILQLSSMERYYRRRGLGENPFPQWSNGS
jgi:hypothetical protein